MFLEQDATRKFLLGKEKGRCKISFKNTRILLLDFLEDVSKSATAGLPS